LVRQIATWDANGTARLYGTVKANVVVPVRLEKSAIEILDEKPHSIEIPCAITREGDTFENLVIDVRGAEVIRSSINGMDGRDRVIIVEIDPRLLSLDQMQSSWTLEFRRMGDNIGTLPIAVRYPRRSVVSPNPLTLHRDAGNFHGFVTIRSDELAVLLENGMQLSGVYLSKADSQDPVPINVRVEPTSATHVRRVRIAMSDRIVSNAISTSVLRFSCGDWQRDIAVKFVDVR
jgi:hypothetical protein